MLGERDRQAAARTAGRSRCSSARSSADNAAQRLKGIEDAIAGHNIEIVDKREDNTDRAKARSNVEDIINAHPDLKLVVRPLVSYNGPAIAAALDGAGQEGQGAGGGVRRGGRHARRHRERHHPGAPSCRSRSSSATSSRKWMHELATKGEAAKAAIPPNKIIDTGVDVINKANVAEFKAKLAEMKKGA